MQPEDFLEDVNSSAVIIHKRQNERGAKSDETTFLASLEHYVGKTTGENGLPKNAECAVPPPVEMRTAVVKKTKYPAPMKLVATVSNVTSVPGKSEQTDEGGWRILASVKYFDEAKNYLEATQSPEYFDPETKALITSKWLTVSPGSHVTIKVPDRPDNIFRTKTASGSMYVIQPSAPLKFNNVVGEIWVSKKEETNAETGAKAVAVYAHPCYECKGKVEISEDYDPMMDRSERIHDLKRYNLHALVPISELRAHPNRVPSTLAFYIGAGVQTRYMPDGVHGTTVVRDPIMDRRDLVNEWQGAITPAATIRAYVYQWAGSPNKNEKYAIYAMGTKATADTLWRSYGITNINAYVSIIGMNPALPVYVETTVWTKATLELESNAPDKVNNRDELQNFKGTYKCLINSVVPCFLRYFRECGLRLSQSRVETEFEAWKAESKGKVKRSTLNLTPKDPTKANPLHVNGLEESAVIALGNGQLDPTDPEGATGLNHAYAGNIISLFEKGAHDFYVLVSYAPSAADLAYLGTVAYADEYLDRLIEGQKVEYWIYAVRKDAKMARSYGAAAAAAKKEPKAPQHEEEPVLLTYRKLAASPAPYSPAQPMKRERQPESEDEEESSSSSSSSSGNERRTKKQN